MKVGVLVIVALAALTALIFLMSGTSGGLFTRQIVVHSFFKNASGLKAGAPVNLQGVTIGSVKRILIVPRRKQTPVEVVMKVGTRYKAALHTDSLASLATAGVLGDTFVDIDSTHATGPQLRNGDELLTKTSPSLADVINSSQTVIKQVNVILAKVNTMADALGNSKGSLGEFINNPALYNQAVGTLRQAQVLVKRINRGQGTLGKLVTDQTMYNNANATIAKLQNIVDQINAGQGTVGKLVKDPALYNNANNLIGGINHGQGTLGMIAKDQAFRNRVSRTVADLQAIVQRANAGQGTVGKLLHDPALYNDSNRTIVEMRELLQAIRKNPKKYLVIRLKIF
ncbi:MAG: MlaD family protein [Acidobacteriaceae bacterium]